MITPEDIEKAIAQLTAEAKLCACLDEIEARLLEEEIGRDATSGSRRSEHRPMHGADGRMRGSYNEPQQQHYHPADQPRRQPD